MPEPDNNTEQASEQTKRRRYRFWSVWTDANGTFSHSFGEAGSASLPRANGLLEKCVALTQTASGDVLCTA